MSNLRQAAQQALEALIPLANAGCPNERECLTDQDHERAAEAVEVLEQAFAKPEQEPVAWMYPHQLQEVKEYGRGGLGVRAYSGPSSPNLVPVYTAPTPRKPLTDLELRAVFILSNTAEPLAEGWPGLERFARAIERAHGIGGDA